MFKGWDTILVFLLTNPCKSVSSA